MTSVTNLRQFLSILQKQNQLVEIPCEVDPTLELAEIHRQVVAQGGPALLFTNVKGSPFSLTSNLFGTRSRVDLAFANRPEDWVESMCKFLHGPLPPNLSTLWEKRSDIKQLFSLGTKRTRRAPVCEVEMSRANLNLLPMTKSWPEDGGHFLTLPLVYTESISCGPPNLGIYRVQRYSENQAGMHWQIGKGGGFHHHAAEKLNQALPTTIFLGGAPALMLSAIAPLPENVPEIILASLLQGKKIGMGKSNKSSHPMIAECEFALIGKVPPHKRKLEGPFGDHYGYYSLEHDFPVFECETIYHRKDAIFPATVVGKPRQEDFYLGEYLQELLSPLFPIVMPSVKSLWSYGETGFHSLSAAVVKERYGRESMVSAFRILGEGQLSLTKFLLLTDQPVDLKNFKQTLPHILERFRPESDLYIFSNLSMDTLDYTGPKLNEGSKGILLGMGEKMRDLPEIFTGTLPGNIRAVKPFCPGCLVIEGENLEGVVDHENFAKWPLLIFVDDVKKTLKSTETFLWTVFTRFEPAADIHTKPPKVFRHHLSYSGPILIDARMKPSYPKELVCDEETAALVKKRWGEYFPDALRKQHSLEEPN